MLACERYAFGEFEATEMMIIVHEEGVGFQNESLGWRSWNLTASQALVVCALFCSTVRCALAVEHEAWLWLRTTSVAQMHAEMV